MTWLWLAPLAQEAFVHQLWEFEAWEELATRGVRLARESGALAVLPVALVYMAGVQVHAGDFAAASALIEEADAITAGTRYVPVTYASLVLVAWRGDEAAASQLIDVTVEDAALRGEGTVLGLAGYVTAILYNGLSRYEDALAAAQRTCEHEDLGFFNWCLAELIEAAARTGAHEDAMAALRELEARTSAAGTDWALGIQARSRALLSDGDDADALYREAIQRLGRIGIAVHLARAQLVYGEWLRREKRRGEARDQLRAAHDVFSRVGAEAFAERARRELLATGETARERTVDTRDLLTPQEAQIARMAHDGHTNPEIGAELFISPRTVEYHLSKVFQKLGVSSRRELRRALPARPS
jgi:DNA-binding CsgD family transcriptional regulator